jgi:Alw26I/Eco31I/Esp3I family type II restriction m6 adenine DNA methyltransferase
MPPKIIHDLVEKFARNSDAYLSPQYKEAEVRREFIDPFFEALGWDVQNQRGYAENYKDVVHEPSLDDESGSKRAPDYAFQPGGRIRFYVEAKKPKVSIENDPGPAHQIRMYGWTKQLPISLLTNFAELAIYDCRIEPRVSDAPPAARLDYFTYEQYISRWDELVALFSPEAIFQGSFDRYVETRRRRGAAPFDVRFLDDMEDWRRRLAENIALRNPQLSQGDLNYAVQQTIDRIIFLRICEARGIEPFGRLRDLGGPPDIYANLVEYFRVADDAYNSGLFHFQRESGRDLPDDLTPGLAIDDSVLKLVLKQLYWPDRPYAFEVVPADILGQVYERFLGKEIYLTAAHRAKVKEKPEVRRAGGVYYTPTYVVEYIVKHTVGKLLEGKTWKEASRLRIVDPACGSGSFLLGAFEFLLNWYRDQYVEDGPDKHKKRLYGTPAGWKVTISEKKQILINNIFGVDIDPQAVEVTKLSLLLKVLEGESEQTVKPRLIREPALPDLDNNIKCGNSLIGSDFDDSILGNQVNEQDRKQANSFDWSSRFPSVRNGKFDAVIGNPPYDVLEKDRGEASWPHDLLALYAKESVELAPAFGGKLNLYRFFIVKSMELVKKDGYYGMIVPLSLLADISCANTRRHLITTSADLVADCFPQKDNANRRIFMDAKLSTVIVTCRKVGSDRSRTDAEFDVRTYPWNSFDDPHKAAKVKLSDAVMLDPKNSPVPLVDQPELELCRKLHHGEGVVNLKEVREVSVTRGEINQTVYRNFIVADSELSRLVKGVEIGPYHENTKLSQGTREWFNERAFLRVHKPKSIINSRRVATQRVTGVDERLRVVATIIDPVAYFADSTNSVECSGADYSLEYVLALLNSRLFQWRFKLTSTNNNVGTNELEAMPFRCFSNDDARAIGSKLETMASRMIELYRCPVPRNPVDRERAKRRIAGLDSRINRLVYQLYGLSPEDVELIEGRQE